MIDYEKIKLIAFYEAIKARSLASQGKALADRLWNEQRIVAGHIMQLTGKLYLRKKVILLAEQIPIVVIGAANGTSMAPLARY